MQALGVGDHDGLGGNNDSKQDLGIFGTVFDLGERAVLVLWVVLVVINLQLGFGQEEDVLGCWDHSDYIARQFTVSRETRMNTYIATYRPCLRLG